MRRLFFCCLFIISILSAHAQSTFTQPGDAADCSNMFFRALSEKNNEALDNLLSPDFSVTSFNGQQIDRNFLLEAVSQGYLRIDAGMLSGTRTRNYEDVGIVTGIWNASGRLQNSSFQNDIAYMAVCVRTAGNWKVTAVQFTPVR